MMKKTFGFPKAVCLLTAMLALSACPPQDGYDFENPDNNTETGETGWTVIKNLIFDDLSAFTDYSIGGGSFTVGLSAEQNHTPEATSGKSLKLSGRTYTYQRLRLEVFTPADNGKRFNISMWVYAPSAITGMLGLYAATGEYVDRQMYDIPANTWFEMTWNGYIHTNTTITTIALEESSANGTTGTNTIYLDDIVIEREDQEGDPSSGETNASVRTREEIEQEIDENWSSLGYTAKPTKFMALTYDDGPSDKSEQLMAAFAAKDVRVTFFLIGNRIGGKEGIVRNMRDAGHELANHSHTHISLGSSSLAAIETEIQQCSDAIYNATNADGKPVRPKFFRAPNLNYSTTVYNACTNKGFPLVAGISVMDYGGGANNESAQAMADEVFNNAGEWKITLSHDPASGGNNWNNIIQAVPLIIDGLRFRGYYLLTLSELLVMRGGTPSPGKVYQDFATIP